MDKIKTVKIKNPDGSVSEETYTISIDAKNVDMKNGKDLQDTIGNINVDRDGNIAEQLGKYKDYSDDIEILYANVDSLEATDMSLENDIINLQVNKINKTDIIDNLNSTKIDKTLSANQGRVLKENIENNNETINSILNRITKKRIVLIGDSYLEGYNPDGNVTSWGSYFKNYLELSDSQVIISYLGGSSFAGSRPFTDLVNALAVDEDVTDVIVAGGFNDRTFTKAQILTGMTAFKSACNIKFPNAKIKLAMIGWSSNPEYLYSLHKTCINYKENSSKLGIGFLSGTEYSLHDYFTMFASDNIHPTDLGQQAIAQNIVNAFINGSTHSFLTYKTIGFSASGSCTAISGSISNFSAEVNNNIVQVSSQGKIEFTINNISYTGNGTSDIEVADITSGYIIGSNYKMCSFPVQLVVHGDGAYHKINGILIFRNKKIYISFAEVNNAGNNYLSFTSIDKIQLFAFSGTFDSLFC